MQAQREFAATNSAISANAPQHQKDRHPQPAIRLKLRALLDQGTKIKGGLANAVHKIGLGFTFECIPRARRVPVVDKPTGRRTVGTA